MTPPDLVVHSPQMWQERMGDWWMALAQIAALAIGLFCGYWI